MTEPLNRKVGLGTGARGGTNSWPSRCQGGLGAGGRASGVTPGACSRGCPVTPRRLPLRAVLAAGPRTLPK